MKLLAAGVRPDQNCCREGTREYELQDQETREWMCSQCPKKPGQFHPWFFHIQHLAMMQRSKIPMDAQTLSRNEIIGLSIWNQFSEAVMRYPARGNAEPEPEKPVIENEGDFDVSF